MVSGSSSPGNRALKASGYANSVVLGPFGSVGTGSLEISFSFNSDGQPKVQTQRRLVYPWDRRYGTWRFCKRGTPSIIY